MTINNINIINEIKEINNINYKFDKLMNIYEKMNNKYSNDEITIIYNINNEEKIKIFDETFVNNNKDKCKIIYDYDEYDLTEEFNVKNINKLEIKLKSKEEEEEEDDEEVQKQKPKKDDARPNTENQKVTQLSDVLKGKEQVAIENKPDTKEETIVKKDNEKNANVKDVYMENIKESPGNYQMLSYILNPNQEESKKKEVKFKEEPKNEEEKAKIDLEKRKLRLSKKLEQAKKLKQSIDEKNKFRKSEAISEKAAASEKKISNDK